MSSASTEQPCVHCQTPLHAEVRFCFECGTPRIPQFPQVPQVETAEHPLDDLRTAAFSPVSIPPNLEADHDLEPGEAIEIESLAVVEEVPIDLDDTPETDEGQVADPHGTVVAMAPERPMPFWPAPPKGETVVAPPPRKAADLG